MRLTVEAMLRQEAQLESSKESYIVYFGGHSHSLEEASLLSQERVVDSHYEFLGSFLGSKEKAQDAIFYSYTKSINGFAANLEAEEAIEISKHPGVVSVFPNRGHKLHTTHSWEFMGLEANGVVPEGSLWTKAKFGKDVIIGNLDTGVWPEAESFKDDDMGPIPTKWKGTCQNNDTKTQFHCNKKLIGARYFNDGYKSVVPIVDLVDSPRDYEGHGTHTLSTAAGQRVPGATLFGYGTGTATGGAPNARVAAYKVCWPPFLGNECFDVDILAGFDAAIADGVDVLSVSLGGDPGDYLYDAIAIGSFHAVKHGITVVCSAGNSGPTLGTVSNVAPWILTVGASTIDREFPSYVQLRNRQQIKGQSLSPVSLQQKFYPLISSEDARNPNRSIPDATLCISGALDPAKMLMFFLPPISPILMVLLCSLTSNLPRVSIIAAYTGAVGPTTLDFDSRRVLFNSESGTSMSCPHVSGIAGLLKALHPDWSPSAIKSAIITSARTQDNTLEPMSNSTFQKADPFSYGSGHVRPNRAMDPGLVYDLTTNDYLDFLCSLGYNSTQIAEFNGKPYSCPSKPLKIEDLNYPSIAISNLTGAVSLIRTVKNVGTPGTYKVRVIEPPGVSVLVKPRRLKFNKVGEEKKFMVTLKAKSRDVAGDYAFGKLIWSDGKHHVRSPIAVNA
ncbi:Subtilisin-like protease [Cocos nucifera]|uniref:Subtilisin-like protease n=1 Tax=Cocos nucifera TaxID=13894 RepID=A0A8K0MVF2_COCNU|nr:Subtilisin-like protease [Cocos nucifera]